MRIQNTKQSISHQFTWDMLAKEWMNLMKLMLSFEKYTYSKYVYQQNTMRSADLIFVAPCPLNQNNIFVQLLKYTVHYLMQDVQTMKYPGIFHWYK